MWRYVPSTVGASLLLLGFDGTPAAQQRPLPVIDMHLHAAAADAQGPPPLGLCPGRLQVPAWDQRQPWAETFGALTKNPPCMNPVWSPTTDAELRAQTVAVLHRRNVIALTGGSPSMVAAWREAAPNRVMPAVSRQVGPTALSVAAIRALHAKGQVTALAEVTNQYAGIAADDPTFEPYFAMAEELDIPVGIHIGTGPPGAPYLGAANYRARLHSALQLEEPLLKHPKLRVFVMHAGWPMLDDMLAVMWAHPQVHVEVGVLIFALPPAEFYRYVQRIVESGFGARVMFGSDQMVWPGVIEHGIALIENAPFLTPQQKQGILYNNAARFLRLSKADIDRHHGR
jgi:predicted TIM-barrel fold metal-dependent hydrolase